MSRLNNQINLTNQTEYNTVIPFLHRHFLFKHGSGSSAIFNAANQNYPLTSSTVYSPPPRPLPRTTLSRPLFSFSKPYRCCNWKCTALSASAITLTLALLLTYIIGESLIYDSLSLFLSLAGPWLLSCWLGSYGISRTHTVKNSIREMNIYERGMRENER